MRTIQIDFIYCGMFWRLVKSTYFIYEESYICSSLYINQIQLYNQFSKFCITRTRIFQVSAGQHLQLSGDLKGNVSIATHQGMQFNTSNPSTQQQQSQQQNQMPSHTQSQMGGNNPQNVHGNVNMNQGQAGMNNPMMNAQQQQHMPTPQMGSQQGAMGNPMQGGGGMQGMGGVGMQGPGPGGYIMKNMNSGVPRQRLGRFHFFKILLCSKLSCLFLWYSDGTDGVYTFSIISRRASSTDTCGSKAESEWT